MNNDNYNSKIIEALQRETDPAKADKVTKKMLIASRIDAALKVKGWKKKDLAAALKKKPSVITRWLSGTHNFSIDTICDIEKVLQIELIPSATDSKIQKLNLK